MQIIDIGINLMNKSFNFDREEIVENAKNAGVTPIIITGSSLISSKLSANYASKYPQMIYSTAGIHPHDAKTCNDSTMGELEKLANKDCVVAIGECGLDYNRDFSPRDIQRKVFKDQIALAISLKMPLFLHERDAFLDFYSILKSNRPNISNLVVHCFTGNEKELNSYIDLGCYIGVTGWICDERRGVHLRNLVKKIPLGKLMIETDGPYLIPRDLKDKPKDGRNEPKFLPHILKTIAKCIDMDAEKLARLTRENTFKFFNLK